MTLVRALAAVVLCVLWETLATSGASAAVSKVATLTPTLEGPTPPGILASEGGVLVVGDQAPFTGGPATGAVSVFTADRQGHWASGTPAATLMNPAGDGPDGGLLASNLAIDGAVIVADGVDTDGSDPLLVYTRPPAGWSGAIAPAANLTTSTGAQLSWASISGHTIAAGGSDGSIYVYPEPAGGWAGTITESARLLDPGVSLQSVPVVHGDAVYASRNNPLGDYAVFTKPAGGWAGTLAPSGSLRTGGGQFPQSAALAFSGDLAAASSRTGTGTELFRVPSTSPAGRPSPLAYLQYNPAPGHIVFSSNLAVDFDLEQGGPASGTSVTVSAVTRPARGWRGVLTFGRPFVRRSAPAPCCTALVAGVAVSGQTVFVQAASGPIDVFRISGREGGQAPPAQAKRPVIRGLHGGRPRISLYAASTLDLSSISLTLPHGITPSHNQAALRRAVTVMGSRAPAFKIAVRGQTIDLSSVCCGIAGGAIQIGSAALNVSPWLRTDLKRQRRVPRLAVRVAFHDTSGATQHARARLRVAN